MKKLLLVLALLLALVLLSGCGNKDVFDTVYSFDYAFIKLPNGEVVEGKVQSWRDYEDGDQLQIKIDDTIYLCHSINAVLIKGEN